MSRLAVLGRLWSRWYISSVILAGVGIFIGFLILVIFFPGKPQIGIINIPNTVLDNSTASIIGEMLDFASDQDSIKAVVIKINSPGGGAAVSEDLFLKTLRLREKKPVVIAVQEIAASGGYMWAVGSNFIYAKPTSSVGSVGAIVQLFDPPRPNEDLVFTGPAKLTGAPRRTFVQQLEAVKESFLQIVISQRGAKLKITPQELSEAQIYPGMEALRLGLVDAIGSDTDAIKKAADLAGISGYDLVDVNTEVDRLFIKRLERIFGTSVVDDSPETELQFEKFRDLLSSSVGSSLVGVDLPGFPSDLGLPQFYYLYVPPTQ